MLRLCARLMFLWSLAIAALSALASHRVLLGEDPSAVLCAAVVIWLATPLGYAPLGALIGARARGYSALSGIALCALPFVNSWSLAAALAEVSSNKTARVHLAPPLSFILGLVLATLACFLSNLTLDADISRALSALALASCAVAPPLLRAIGLLLVEETKPAHRRRACASTSVAC